MNEDSIRLFKEKFKLSNKEVDWIKNTRWIFDFFSKMDTAELAFEFEKNEAKKEAAFYLAKKAFVSQDRLDSVVKLSAEAGEALLSPKDLSELVAPVQIGEAYREIRLGQLRKIYRTKADALVDLKKKYAEKNSKP